MRQTGTIMNTVQMAPSSAMIPQYFLRDNTRSRVLGHFGTEDEALRFLVGQSDGYYSVNDRSGGWCEIEIWKGERFIRRALMRNSSPAPFTRIGTIAEAD